MEQSDERSKSLASLAVFRELYNNNKDVYIVISEFIKNVIASNAMYHFSLTEITHLLNSTFEFSIPEFVVAASLQKVNFIQKDERQQYFVVEPEKIANNKVSNELSKLQDSHKEIITELFTYIEHEKSITLSDNEKEKVLSAFCSFIIDDTSRQLYTEYISAFLIKNKTNHDFISKINLIKEGVVLYTGLRYNPKPNEVGFWNTDFTIFIDTEILFHLAGYNGEIYKKLFQDFFDLINEVNLKNRNKKGKALIDLKYFSEVKDEINNFFGTAESIIKQNRRPIPSKLAMNSILNGCNSPADVLIKKTIFFDLLKQYLIVEDTYNDYYSDENKKYTIDFNSVITNLIKVDDFYSNEVIAKVLNYVNVLRENVNNVGFENSRFILLTGKTSTLQMAWDKTVKNEGDVPLATSLNFITNKFWFKLNKGFGKGTYPKTFDIITKAQIVLSTQINESVSKKYEELLFKSQNGEFTPEQTALSIAELRRQVKSPEEINETDIDSTLKIIEEDSINRFVEDHELFKAKAKAKEDENKELKELLEREKTEKIAKEEELIYYREEEAKKKVRNEKRKKIQKKVVFIFILIVLLVGCVWLYLYQNKAVGIITGSIAGSFTILSFFDINYKRVKTFIINNIRK